MPEELDPYQVPREPSGEESSGEEGIKLGRALGCTLFLLILLGVGGAFGYAAFQRGLVGARASKCAVNLRQVGLSGIQYADDKRFLPHVRATRDYDGDETTDHASRAVGSLFYYGYLDDPSRLICPVGEDRAYTGPFPADRRDWDWSGQVNPTPDLTPFLAPGLAPTLEDSIELSFAWTRRGLNRSLSSTAILAADRVASAHGAEAGWQVVHGDATVSFVKETDAERQTLTLLDRRGGCLSLLD